MARQKRYPGVSKLPNGRYRAIIGDPDTGKNLSVATVLGIKGKTWDTAPEAFAAREQANAKLREASDNGVLLAEWWQTWTTSPLWLRPKESTNIQNRQSTRPFIERYGDLALSHFDESGPGGRGTMGDQIVAEWLAGGKRRATVMALRAMFNDACSREAGRLLSINPFAGLRAERSHGRGRIDPPSAEVAAAMVAAARGQSPSFAMWLKFAMATGLRPGELDALRWEPSGEYLSCHVAGDGRIFVGAQFNSKTRTFTLPKNGQQRHAVLTKPAREALAEIREVGLPGPFCFPLADGSHFSAQSRTYYFKPVRAVVGWTGKGQDLYLATRHYAAKYLYNDLRMAAEDVAAALGHTDNGELVRKTYGHFNIEEALERVEKRVAAAQHGLRPIDGGAVAAPIPHTFRTQTGAIARER